MAFFWQAVGSCSPGWQDLLPSKEEAEEEVAPLYQTLPILLHVDMGKNKVKVTLSHSTLLRQKSLGLTLAVYFSKRQGLAIKRAFKKFPKFLNMEE